MVAFLFAIFFLCSIFFTACEEPSVNNQNFKIMNWNVQALMDLNIDGSEFSDFSLGEYDRETYRRRIRKVCDVIDDIDAQVVILEEVENSNVLKDMIDMYLGRRGYIYYGSIKEEDSAISIGFISKIKATNIQIHSVKDSRSVLSLDYECLGDTIRILACHGKSQIGGFEQTEEERINLSKTLKRIIDDSEGMNIICVGDFNEDPNINANFQTALYNIDRDNAFFYRNNGSLLLSSSKYNLFKDILYSPQLDNSLNLSKKGTYMYNNTWYNFDLFLLNNYFFDQNSVEYKDFDIYSPQKISTSSGTPYKWESSMLCGISDHFPIYLTIKCNKYE